MPPKKTTAVAREDTTVSDSNPREGRTKRGAPTRDPDDVSVVSHVPSFEIGSLDHASLRKYRKVMHLQLPSDRTSTHENPNEAPKRYRRVEKEEELISAVKRHWNSTQCKESEVITSFFYSIKNQDRTFKLRFVEASRN